MALLLRAALTSSLLALVACARPPSHTSASREVRGVAADIAGGQRIAERGSCALESGEQIEDCRIGYRTYGQLAADKSNAVVFPTWFTGTTASLAPVVPDKLVDTRRFFLVLVDALGDGVSSSPSNSRSQARLRFPRFTIRDMVETQRRLLREILGVERPYAVVGISMGGMQAMEWSVAHPDELARAVSIVGTPQLTSHDLLLWNAELHALDADKAYANGGYVGRPKIRAVQDIHWLMLTTPRHRATETSRAAFTKWLEEKESDVGFDWNDWHRQLEAMIDHDVARAHGGSIAQAASRVKAKMLVVVAAQDHMVEPGPAKAFAQALGTNAELFVLEGPCGHLAPTEACEGRVLGERVRAFLDH